MQARPEAREHARLLRRQGASIKQIARAVGASRSSVSVWVRDIELSKGQRSTLYDRVRANGGRNVGHLRRSQEARDARLAAQRDGRERAAAGNALHRAGCMLYWGEGSKDRNRVIFTNADPDMHRFFLRFLLECYEVPPAEIRLSVNCFLTNGLSLEQVEDWWLGQLDLPTSCLRKAAVNRPSRASKGRRPQLMYGTARLELNSTFIVQSIYGAIQEYAGFERPEWLDIRIRCRLTAMPATVQVDGAVRQS